MTPPEVFARLDSENPGATGAVVALGFPNQSIQTAGRDVRLELTVPLGPVVVDEPPAEVRQVSPWETFHGGGDFGDGGHGDRVVLLAVHGNGLPPSSASPPFFFAPTSRQSPMASLIRSITSLGERACVWDPGMAGTEAT